MSEKNVVLLLTHRQDFYNVDLVADALRRLGARPFRIDTDRFPTDLKLTVELDESQRNTLVVGSETLPYDRIRAVWMRHLGMPTFDGEDLDPTFQQGCFRESYAALVGFFDGLRGCRFVDRLENVDHAENKLHQLRVARACGLSTPRTLLTNDPEKVRSFYDAENGNIIAKMLTPLTTSMDGSSAFVRTSRVGREDLAALESLRLSPMCFQAEVPKKHELRVIYVGGRFFAGGIDASGTRGSVDWRLVTKGEAPWFPATLPPAVSARLHDFMQKMQLSFGALDVIVTPEGEHVFLEVNPTGEWGMLVRDLDLPIPEALAELLWKEDTSGF